MAYTVKNYPTKKSLKADLAAGVQVEVYQEGPYGPEVRDGRVALEGPHYPQPHSWYASATVQGGYIVGSIK